MNFCSIRRYTDSEVSMTVKDVIEDAYRAVVATDFDVIVVEHPSLNEPVVLQTIAGLPEQASRLRRAAASIAVAIRAAGQRFFRMLTFRRC